MPTNNYVKVVAFGYRAFVFFDRYNPEKVLAARQEAAELRDKWNAENPKDQAHLCVFERCAGFVGIPPIGVTPDTLTGLGRAPLSKELS